MPEISKEIPAWKSIAPDAAAANMIRKSLDNCSKMVR